MKMYTVYKHTNKSNGKVYIGITSKKPEKRWCGGYNYKGHFRHAIDKYGWDNFDHEILYENLEEMQAKLLEISLIRFYDSTNQNKGYNISTGGESASGYHFSEESKKHMSEIRRGRKLSDQAKKNISDGNKGRHTTTKYNIQRRIPIQCIETQEVFESFNDAAKRLGIDIGSVRQSVNRGWAVKGLHFKKI